MLCEKGRPVSPKPLAFNVATNVYLKLFLITTYYETQDRLIELARLPNS
jgi:hypothetical protein